jgi:hypothetical protein
MSECSDRKVMFECDHGRRIFEVYDLAVEYFSVSLILSNVNCATRETLSSRNLFFFFCRRHRPCKCMRGTVALFYMANKNTTKCLPYILICIMNYGM